MTAVIAKFKNARISPQKVRVVAGKLAGMPVPSAIDFLLYSDKKASAIIQKVLMSAVANAEHNESLDVDELKIVRVVVDQGLRLKRWRPRAKGRASGIIKRSSTITVVVSD